MYGICLSLSDLFPSAGHEVHPGCCKWLYFLPFCSCIIFHHKYENIPLFLYPSSIDRHLGHFHVFIMNNTTMNLYLFSDIVILFPLDVYPGLLDYMVILFLIFLKNFHTIFHSCSPAVHTYSLLPPSLPVLNIFSFWI